MKNQYIKFADLLTVGLPDDIRTKGPSVGHIGHIRVLGEIDGFPW